MAVTDDAPMFLNKAAHLSHTVPDSSADFHDRHME